MDSLPADDPELPLPERMPERVVGHVRDPGVETDLGELPPPRPAQALCRLPVLRAVSSSSRAERGNVSGRQRPTDLARPVAAPDHLPTGRVDLILHDGSGRVAAVFEVKRFIASESARAAARRQAMDYAGQTGAPMLVVTDADRYEILRPPARSRLCPRVGTGQAEATRWLVSVLFPSD